MGSEKATPRYWHSDGAKSGSANPPDIVADWERGTLIAGLVVAVSFGLMFVAGAML